MFTVNKMSRLRKKSIKYRRSRSLKKSRKRTLSKSKRRSKRRSIKRSRKRSKRKSRRRYNNKSISFEFVHKLIFHNKPDGGILDLFWKTPVTLSDEELNTKFEIAYDYLNKKYNKDQFTKIYNKYFSNKKIEEIRNRPDLIHEIKTKMIMIEIYNIIIELKEPSLYLAQQTALEIESDFKDAIGFFGEKYTRYYENKYKSVEQYIDSIINKYNSDKIIISIKNNDDFDANIKHMLIVAYVKQLENKPKMEDIDLKIKETLQKKLGYYISKINRKQQELNIKHKLALKYFEEKYPENMLSRIEKLQQSYKDELKYIRNYKEQLIKLQEFDIQEQPLLSYFIKNYGDDAEDKINSLQTRYSDDLKGNYFKNLEKMVDIDSDETSLLKTYYKDAYNYLLKRYDNSNATVNAVMRKKIKDFKLFVEYMNDTDCYTLEKPDKTFFHIKNFKLDETVLDKIYTIMIASQLKNPIFDYFIKKYDKDIKNKIESLLIRYKEEIHDYHGEQLFEKLKEIDEKETQIVKENFDRAYNNLELKFGTKSVIKNFITKGKEDFKNIINNYINYDGIIFIDTNGDPFKVKRFHLDNDINEKILTIIISDEYMKGNEETEYKKKIQFLKNKIYDIVKPYFKRKELTEKQLWTKEDNYSEELEKIYKDGKRVGNYDYSETDMFDLEVKDNIKQYSLYEFLQEEDILKDHLANLIKKTYTSRLSDISRISNIYKDVVTDAYTNGIIIDQLTYTPKFIKNNNDIKEYIERYVLYKQLEKEDELRKYLRTLTDQADIYFKTKNIDTGLDNIKSEKNKFGVKLKDKKKEYEKELHEIYKQGIKLGNFNYTTLFIKNNKDIKDNITRLVLWDMLQIEDSLREPLNKFAEKAEDYFKNNSKKLDTLKEIYKKQLEFMYKNGINIKGLEYDPKFIENNTDIKDNITVCFLYSRLKEEEIIDKNCQEALKYFNKYYGKESDISIENIYDNVQNPGENPVYKKLKEYEKSWTPVPESRLDVVIYPKEVQLKQRIYYYYLLDTWYKDVTGWKESWYKLTSLFRVIGYLIYKIIDYFWSIPYYYKNYRDLTKLRNETNKEKEDVVKIVATKTYKESLEEHLKKGAETAIIIDEDEEKTDILTELPIKKEITPGRKIPVKNLRKKFLSSPPRGIFPYSTRIFETPKKPKPSS